MQPSDAEFVLFLDFDGVLHPAVQGAEPFCRLELLGPLFSEFPRIGIVVSSSWRAAYAADVLQEFLGPFGGHLIGVTSNAHHLCAASVDSVLMTEPPCEMVREAECRQWIEKHSPSTSWIALDDQAELFSGDCLNLVACDPIIGLTRQVVDRVRSIVRQRIGQIPLGSHD